MFSTAFPGVAFALMEHEPHANAPRGLVLAAFAAIYLIWGSTYLAIRFAVESIPPFLLGGGRFLVAGGLLYGWLRWRGVPNPAAVHWRNAAVVGCLMLGVGNGGVNWAEQRVPSSLTALLIAVTPVWFALLDWARPGGARPSAQTALGIVVGFAGVAMLVGARDPTGSHAAIQWTGVAALMAASICWASGSLYARYTPKPASPLMAGAIQMLAGGAALMAAGWLEGETAAFDGSRVSARSAWAFVYLSLAGSLVGFTAFSWLLKVSTPARISTYAYVNPVIAVILGWAIGGERPGARALAAAAVIVVGVIVITARKPVPGPANPKATASADRSSRDMSDCIGDV